MTDGRASGRDQLPIPDRGAAWAVTYDAKDPDTSFPAIQPLRPPDGAPNVLIVLSTTPVSARRARSAARARRPWRSASPRAA